MSTIERAVVFAERETVEIASQFAGFLFLPAALYYLSAAFINYWPIGLFQFALAFSSFALLKRTPTVSMAMIFFGVSLFSLIAGFLLSRVDNLPFWSWPGGNYLLVHLVWIFGILKVSGCIDETVSKRIFRLAITGLLFGVCLMNAGTIDENQRYIAIVEALLVMLGLLAFEKMERLPGWLLVWIGVIGLLLIGSSFLLEREGMVLEGRWRAVQVFIHFCFAVTLLIWLRLDERALHYAVGAILGAVVFYTGIVALVWVSVADPYAYNWFGEPPLFLHIRHVGYLFCVGIVVSAWAALIYKGRAQKVAWLAYMIAMTLLLWSGSRGAFAGGVAGILTLLATRAPLSVYKRAWFALLVGLAVALLISALFPVKHSGLGWVSAVLRSDAADSVNRLSSGRLTIWGNLWEYVVQRPWLGWGGDYVRQIMQGKHVLQAHNAIVQLLVEWGFVGLFVICSPMLGIWMKGIGRLRSFPIVERDSLSLGIAVLFALFLLSMVDGIFYYGLPLVYLALGYALLFARRNTAAPGVIA
ncbi:O-Antigen ligase [compost metagenome]